MIYFFCVFFSFWFEIVVGFADELIERMKASGSLSFFFVCVFLSFFFLFNPCYITIKETFEVSKSKETRRERRERIFQNGGPENSNSSCCCFSIDPKNRLKAGGESYCRRRV